MMTQRYTCEIRDEHGYTFTDEVCAKNDQNAIAIVAYKHKIPMENIKVMSKCNAFFEFPEWKKTFKELSYPSPL